MAIKSGINYIDTAPFYGQGKSEQVLGQALKDVPREAYYIATKVGRYELDVEKQFNFTAKKVAEEFDNSLRYLGLDHVDIIQVRGGRAALVKSINVTFVIFEYSYRNILIYIFRFMILNLPKIWTSSFRIRFQH